MCELKICLRNSEKRLLGQEVMPTIVSNAEADAAKSGVQCRIMVVQMAYCDFLEKYDN